MIYENILEKAGYNLSTVEIKTYATLFHSLEQETDIPWKLIAATVWVESNYNPNAHNKKTNCKGIMQLKSNTAKWIAEKHNINYSESMLWNPVSNIILGTYYLKANSKNGLKHAVNTFVGGPKYKKGNYQKYYCNTVWKEYQRLLKLH